MKENILLFLTHFDDYLDVCLGLNTQTKFDTVRIMKKELLLQRSKISLVDYHAKEADIFYEYLKLVEVIDN